MPWSMLGSDQWVSFQFRSAGQCLQPDLEGIIRLLVYNSDWPAKRPRHDANLAICNVNAKSIQTIHFHETTFLMIPHSWNKALQWKKNLQEWAVCGASIVNRLVNGDAGLQWDTVGQLDTSGHQSVSTITVIMEELLGFLGI